MRELWVWRGIAAVACVGWALTAWWPGTTEAPARAPVAPDRDRPTLTAEADAPEQRARARLLEQLRKSTEAGRGLRERSQALPAVEGEVTEVALERARDEVREEMRARRETMREEMLGRMLDGAASFADEHKLDPEAHQALEDAVLAMHQRMGDLGPPDPFSERRAPEDHRQAMRLSFEQLRADLTRAVGPELAELFQEQMRPGRPGPPPPAGP